MGHKIKEISVNGGQAPEEPPLWLVHTARPIFLSDSYFLSNSSNMQKVSDFFIIFYTHIYVIVSDIGEKWVLYPFISERKSESEAV